MNAERWQKVEKIFHEALEREPAERVPFLVQVCAGDASLLSEVEGLLCGDEAAGSFLETAGSLPAGGTMTGKSFGTYQVKTLLGSGGMGQVYRAWDSKLKRDVAIKVLPTKFSRDSERVFRFQREAEILASLNHPHIAAIYDLGHFQGARLLILELVEGETLRERIERGAIPMGEALTIAVQIAEALEVAHEKGIVHRDLKPANIMITPRGQVKVLDFGLAKLLPADDSVSNPSDSPTQLSASASGAILGTAAYMSPEQARGQAIDAQSDIWAIGCVIYEMLTGKQAFTGETTADVLGAIVRSEPNWNALPPNTPLLLHLFLRLCLQENRAARLHHIGDARIQLEAVSMETASATQPAAKKVGRKRRSLSLIAVAAALLTIGAGLASLAILYFEVLPVERPAMTFSIPAPEKAVFPLGGNSAAPFPAISHNGLTAAFLAISDGVQRIWIRSVDSLDARPLAGTEGVARGFPFFSPDDRFLAFFAQGKLKKIDPAGGPAQVICDAEAVYSGSWNRNGVIIFSGTSGGLRRVPADGGNAEPLTVPDASRHETSHIFPEFLPDGDHFLFLSRTLVADGYAIMAGSLGSKDIKAVLKVDSFVRYDSGHLLFVRDGTLIAQSFDAAQLRLTGNTVRVADHILVALGAYALAASGNGTLIYRTTEPGIRKLQWFDRSGKFLSTVGPPGAYLNPELSSDGKRIAVQQTDPQSQNTDIWLIDVASGEPRRWTFDPGFDVFPIWSAKGEQMAFATARNGGNFDVKGLDGGGEELLVKGATILNDWSRNGRYLVYGDLEHIMVQPLLGDRKPFLYVQSSAAVGNARISPDGKWLAFFSTESGRFEVYIRNFPVPSAKYEISKDGGSEPRWRRDGKEIFYVSPDRKLIARSIRTTDSGLEFSAPSVLFSISGGRAFDAAAASRQQYDVTADGERFLVNSPADQTTDPHLTVVTNWLASVKH